MNDWMMWCVLYSLTCLCVQVCLYETLKRANWLCRFVHFLIHSSIHLHPQWVSEVNIDCWHSVSCCLHWLWQPFRRPYAAGFSMSILNFWGLHVQWYFIIFWRKTRNVDYMKCSENKPGVLGKSPKYIHTYTHFHTNNLVRFLFVTNKIMK